MQEINLLQNRLKDHTVVWDKRNKIITSVFSLILILEIGLGVAFFLLNQQVEAKQITITTENTNIQSELNSRQPVLLEATAFQAQLKNLRVLVTDHLYWSSFFDELSKNTFNKAQYVSLSGDVAGKMHLEGRVASYADLGKALLGLSTSDKFKDVKLISANPTSGENAGYNFSLDFKVNPEIFIKK